MRREGDLGRTLLRPGLRLRRHPGRSTGCTRTIRRWGSSAPSWRSCRCTGSGLETPSTPTCTTWTPIATGSACSRWGCAACCWPSRFRRPTRGSACSGPYWVARLILVALVSGRDYRKGFLSFTVAATVTGPLMVVGGLLQGDVRLGIWTLAAAIDLSVLLVRAPPTRRQSVSSGPSHRAVRHVHHHRARRNGGGHRRGCGVGRRLAPRGSHGGVRHRLRPVVGLLRLQSGRDPRRT